MAFLDNLTIHYQEVARHPVSDQDYSGQDIRFSTLFESLEQALAVRSQFWGL